MSLDLLANLLLEDSTGDEIEDLRDSICRNIKILLETRKSLATIPEVYPETAASNFDHGLDVWNMSHSLYHGNRLARSLGNLILRYEPRLKDVSIELLSKNQDDNCLHFRIDGVFTIEHKDRTETGTLTFQSAINLTSHSLSFKENPFD
ncbi:type VI secretion system baseplate subunit TssE [Endozoicomonas arenosclerae]|uniref:type VI secretion system baseplate subunit TssE n=1 Tax=Endozoicomonas arenosclerae TaxID=1633495 RepID=UPI0007817D3D|nr:type VI secretion system baseplate subunit TssE [Endozoicomonas arenosclerae]